MFLRLQFSTLGRDRDLATAARAADFYQTVTTSVKAKMDDAGVKITTALFRCQNAIGPKGVIFDTIYHLNIYER